jgi:hypothetical protein
VKVPTGLGAEAALRSVNGGAATNGGAFNGAAPTAGGGASRGVSGGGFEAGLPSRAPRGGLALRGDMAANGGGLTSERGARFGGGLLRRALGGLRAPTGGRLPRNAIGGIRPGDGGGFDAGLPRSTLGGGRPPAGGGPASWPARDAKFASKAPGEGGVANPGASGGKVPTAPKLDTRASKSVTVEPAPITVTSRMMTNGWPTGKVPAATLSTQHVGSAKKA